MVWGTFLEKMVKSRLKKVPRLREGGGGNYYLGNAHIEVTSIWKGLPLCRLLTWLWNAVNFISTDHQINKCWGCSSVAHFNCGNENSSFKLASPLTSFLWSQLLMVMRVMVLLMIILSKLMPFLLHIRIRVRLRDRRRKDILILWFIFFFQSMFCSTCTHEYRHHFSDLHESSSWYLSLMKNSCFSPKVSTHRPSPQRINIANSCLMHKRNCQKTMTSNKGRVVLS